ncbi:sodium/hydrogen exchanger family protein [Mycobacterium xenopi 4042]|uniref:Sodium/hydrogen exchanger family protein n=1 Tax=Mycobacterium xenopi 4042 TaxID=1299334 RepID=X7YIR3_MYCXE|nr:sodium/hydrogen exchanger family protein [Mycobacterium xenopi 4042]
MQIPVPLLLQLGALLTALALLGALARRYALSPIPVYLLAGLALGTAGSRRCRRPASSSARARRSVWCCCCSPWAGVLGGGIRQQPATPSAIRCGRRRSQRHPGALTGWVLGLDGIGILAMAGVTYVSSSGVIARLLEDLHRIGNRETPAVLAVLVLEDFAMAGYLPLFAVLASGGRWFHALAGMVAAITALTAAFTASYRWATISGGW